MMKFSNFLETASKEASDARKRYKESDINIEEVMQNVYNELTENICTATMHGNNRIKVMVPEGNTMNKLLDIVSSSISKHISPEFAVFAFKIVCRTDAVEILKRKN
jgi:hypothetical protein